MQKHRTLSKRPFLPYVSTPRQTQLASDKVRHVISISNNWYKIWLNSRFSVAAALHIDVVKNENEKLSDGLTKCCLSDQSFPNHFDYFKLDVSELFCYL